MKILKVCRALRVTLIDNFIQDTLLNVTIMCSFVIVPYFMLQDNYSISFYAIIKIAIACYKKVIIYHFMRPFHVVHY
jgi:hypothetical protein